MSTNVWNICSAFIILNVSLLFSGNVSGMRWSSRYLSMWLVSRAEKGILSTLGPKPCIGIRHRLHGGHSLCQKTRFLLRPLFESTHCTSSCLLPFTYPASQHYTGNFHMNESHLWYKDQFFDHVWQEKEQQNWRQLSIRLYIPLSRNCIKWRQSHFASRLWKENEFQGSL